MHLFLAPHPDDATLSCGGTIHHVQHTENQACVILTIAAGDPPDPLPDTPHVRELHKRWQAGESPMAARREEDRHAAAKLGAEIVIWTFLDCVYRVAPDGIPLYPGLDDYKIDVSPLDPLAHDLRTIILPHQNQITHIYAPLGVGHHVDHQVVRDWVLELARQRPELTVLFYEDYPYAELPDMTRQALEFYTEHHITLIPSPYGLHDRDVEVKLSAIQQYTSQISTFWGSIEDMRGRVRAYMHSVGTAEGVNQPVERYWRLVI